MTRPGPSVLTLAAGREAHLRRMVEALVRSDVAPAELIVVRLDGAIHDLGGTPFPIRSLSLPDGAVPRPGLRLAAARNLAATAAASETLLFLDVDCMPSAQTLGAVADALDVDATVCPEVLYLGAPVLDGWSEANLARRGMAHPVRAFPRIGARVEANPGLVWSLALGIRATTFRRIGGFDAGYLGYGAEDTDLGFAAAAAGVPLLFLGGAPVFHQCHAVFDPPLHHFDDILRNARRFHGKWGTWPMDGWLAAFAALGLIAWEVDGETLDVVRAPSPAEIAAAGRPDGTPF